MLIPMILSIIWGPILPVQRMSAWLSGSSESPARPLPSWRPGSGPGDWVWNWKGVNWIQTLTLSADPTSIPASHFFTSPIYFGPVLSGGSWGGQGPVMGRFTADNGGECHSCVSPIWQNIGHSQTAHTDTRSPATRGHNIHLILPFYGLGFIAFKWREV